MIYLLKLSDLYDVLKYVLTHIDEKFNRTLPGQNGIWVKSYHFWPKNDGEKWWRKNIFETPHALSHYWTL